MGTPETEAYSNPWGQTTLLPTDISTANIEEKQNAFKYVIAVSSIIVFLCGLGDFKF